jgi:ribosomal protein S18 acetylase RimI-like enzyme
VQLQKLDHQNADQARRIWSLLHDAYSVEANVICADEFPPLRRTVSEISSASSQFFGICDEARLFAVCEVSINGDNCWEIVSFGVEPSSLRQGYGSMLLRHLISRAGVVALSVSTASANAPGIKFYEKHGFACGDEWLTPERIAMVRLARSATLSDSGTQ